MPNPARCQIAIVGAGCSGICLGIQLKRAGIDTFAIFEKSDRVGGTWRDNSYPSVACDVPSLVYCFSFAHKTNWTRKFAPQAEIQQYLEHCAKTFHLLSHIRFGVEIAAIRFDEVDAAWHLFATTGEEFVADVLVCAVGQLNRPAIPQIPGLNTFRGERFHSARWNHAYDFADRRVAVIGNAASAIQFIPQIARKVRHLIVLQRTPNWIRRRRDRARSARELAMFRQLPWLARIYRWALWLKYEGQFPAFRGSRLAQHLMRKSALRNLARVAEPALRAKLVPDYPIGAKRLLISDEYYQALERPNVSLVTSPIAQVTEDAIMTEDGSRHRVDAIIFATGFQSTAFLAPMHIEGLGGRPLSAEWSQGAHAYLGMTVAGFPNFFMMYGPNTNLGHNSVLFMIECQTHYIVQAIRTLFKQKLAWIDVRRDVMDSWNARLQALLGTSVWAAVAKSWYKNDLGLITNNWPGTTVGYWWRTRRFDPGCFEKRESSPTTNRLMDDATTPSGPFDEAKEQINPPGDRGNGTAPHRRLEPSSRPASTARPAKHIDSMRESGGGVQPFSPAHARMPLVPMGREMMG
jgi:cation diffusion facilitator CzcD-associated flavoprotein CzcO